MKVDHLYLGVQTAPGLISPSNGPGGPDIQLTASRAFVCCQESMYADLVGALIAFTKCTHHAAASNKSSIYCIFHYEFLRSWTCHEESSSWWKIRWYDNILPKAWFQMPPWCHLPSVTLLRCRSKRRIQSEVKSPCCHGHASDRHDRKQSPSKSAFWMKRLIP